MNPNRSQSFQDSRSFTSSFIKRSISPSSSRLNFLNQTEASSLGISTFPNEKEATPSFVDETGASTSGISTVSKENEAAPAFDSMLDENDYSDGEKNNIREAMETDDTKITLKTSIIFCSRKRVPVKR